MARDGGYRPPILADVARAAGVSVPTVSRVLGGTKYVAPELVERVRAAITLIGYRPNGAARAVRSGRGSLVSILAGSTVNYGYAQTIAGVETAARRAGMSVLIAVVESDRQEDVERALDLALTQPVAGVVVVEFDRPGLAVSHALPSGIPAVAAGGGSRRTHGIPAALIDERAAGQHLTEYLLGLGHPTVHHVAGPREGKHSGRTEGWRSALVAAGARVPQVMNAGWDAASGYRWGSELADRDDVTAVFCGNDELAIGVIRALEDRGRRVPGDVSVAGFDNQPLVRLWRPTLTTVDQDFHNLGERAFHLLEDHLVDAAAARASVVVPPLIVRDSTAAPSHIPHA